MKRQLRNRHIQEVKRQKLGEVTLKHLGSSLIKKNHQLNDVVRVARNNKAKRDWAQRDCDEEYIKEAEALG